MTTEGNETCERCGRATGRLFPGGRDGRVCASCYETRGRTGPGRAEIAGTVALLLGVLLVTAAALGLIYNVLG